MAVSQSKTPQKMTVPNFRDVDKEAVDRARAAVAGGKSDPLTVPADARVSTDKKGKVYHRWNEHVVITGAYRTVSKKGLMDVVIQHKIRQSDDNDGKTFFAHFYYNTGNDINEGHEQMNTRSDGAIITLMEAVGMTVTTLKASVLAKLFPEKGKPGDAPSALVGKTCIANVVQQHEPQIDEKTGKPKKADKDGNVPIQKRDSAESYLPDSFDEE